MVAITLTVGQVEAGTGATTEDATRLLAVATALVERYAPGAPEAVQDEAALRVAGWLHGQPKASIGEATAGPLSATYVRSHLSALRHSGAMALLSLFKTRRAGAI